jgi:hypothetical protein
MSRIREFGKIYPWGCERPSVAMARARRRKEKLLKELEAIDERKRQEAEREKSAKRQKIENEELVIEMVIKYQADRTAEQQRGKSCNNPDTEIVDVEPLQPSIPKARARMDLNLLKAPGRRVGLAYKREPVLEKTMRSSLTNKVVYVDQATSTLNQGVSGRHDIEPLPVPLAALSIVIAERKPDERSCEESGYLTSQAGRIQQAPTEHNTPKIDLGRRVEGGDCSPSRDEVQYLNRDCSEEQQAHVSKIVEANIAAEIQRLKKRKRELENAQESLTGPDGEGQLHWTAEINAEFERLDQELQAVCNQLAQFSLRKASSMSPSS